MNKIIESGFVNAFVKKDKRDRFLFELFGKKRINALTKFAHRPKDILIEKYMHEVEDESKLLSALKEVGYCCNNTAYILGGTHDGEEHMATDALKLVLDDSSASVCLLLNTLAFIKTEVEIGAPKMYLLQVG